jgi:hypothetical protein
MLEVNSGGQVYFLFFSSRQPQQRPPSAPGQQPQSSDWAQAGSALQQQPSQLPRVAIRRQQASAVQRESVAVLKVGASRLAMQVTGEGACGRFRHCTQRACPDVRC